ncbi:MAG: hypothetical protein J2P49_10750 [Methylocapsa sp.]|nr:hypothetical protein [Methylocapsa sp.]
MPLLAMLAALGPAGCGSPFGGPESPQSAQPSDPPGSRLLAGMLGLRRVEPAAGTAGATGEKELHISCPEIRVPQEGAASRAYAGEPPSNANLRYQLGLNETARECAREGSQLALKIGAAGKVLLGPAGSPGSFTVPVRMTIVRKSDNQPVLAKLYSATATIAQNTTEAEFTVISEPLHVPFLQEHADQDYAIRIEMGEGPAKSEHPHKGAKRS